MNTKTMPFSNCVTVTEYRIDAGLRQQNLSFYEGGQQNDEGGQNRYNCTSTYCTGTDVPVLTVLTVPVQMDHVIKTADESITSPKFT